MAPQRKSKIPPNTYKLFYGAHRAYFESTIANADQLTFNEKYAKEAKQLWAAYGVHHPHIKLRYRDGDTSQIRYEPPRSANNYLGADAPAANQPAANPSPPVAPAAPSQPVLGYMVPKMVYFSTSPGGTFSTGDMMPLDVAQVPNVPREQDEEDLMDTASPAHPVRTDFPLDPGEEGMLRVPPLFPMRLKKKRTKTYFIYNGSGSLKAMNKQMADIERDEYEEEDKSNTWRRVKALGQGGWGSAYKWVAFDRDGNPQDDSMVIKLVNYLPLWDRISAFSNDNRDIPREVAAHRTLWAAGDEEDDEERQLAQSYILGYRGYTLERPYKFYRIASDEAVLGTLDNVEDLFDVSKPQFRQRGEKLEEGFGDDDYEFMPVHFIARVWLAIVKGLMHMHKQGLVHRDLKPSNVFLTKISDDVDDPVMGRWGLKPWLGDFGAAVPKEPVRYENPTDFDDMWIPMFGAPEMHQGWPALVRKNKKGEPYPLDEKSDVFGLAVTIWSVMLVGYLNFKAGDLWEFDNNGNPKWKAEDTDHIWTWMGRVELDDVSAHALNDYWMQKDQPQTELMTLLAACLDISPAKRPSLAQLDELITAWIQNTPDPGPPSDNGGNDGDSEQSDEDQPLSRFEYWFGRLENTSNDTSGERTDTIADMAAKY